MAPLSSASTVRSLPSSNVLGQRGETPPDTNLCQENSIRVEVEGMCEGKSHPPSRAKNWFW